MPSTFLVILLFAVAAAIVWRVFHGKGKPVRFSLLSVLLVMAIVAQSITVVLLYSELRKLRKETHWYRNEYGLLTISDRSKIHAIQLRTNEELTWKWRVWIPEGANVWVAQRTDQVPPDGFPKGGSGFHGPVQPGDHVLRAAIRQRLDGEWEWLYEFNGLRERQVIPPDARWFLQKGPSSSTFGGVDHTTEVEDEETGRLLISRYRHKIGTGGPINLGTDDPLPGFMIWLERR
jgi:hypothetical protein